MLISTFTSVKHLEGQAIINIKVNIYVNVTNIINKAVVERLIEMSNKSSICPTEY